MSDKRDEKGNLLPDKDRLTKFGNILRQSSIDELLELANILRGDMSIVGPRPLLTRYLPYYKEKERVRHSVRPGLTGLAQINGRNNIFIISVAILKEYRSRETSRQLTDAFIFLPLICISVGMP